MASTFLALGGAADLMSMVFRQSILQSVVTDEMRGRMQGVFTVVVAGGPRLADLVHGVAGAALGTRAAVTSGGVLVVLGMAAVALFVPQYRKYRAGEHGAAPVEDRREVPGDVPAGALAGEQGAPAASLD